MTMEIASSFGDPMLADYRLRVREWATRASREHLQAVDEGQLDQTEAGRHWDRLLFEGGFAGVTWPAEYGGGDVGPLEELVLFEELAAVGAPNGPGRGGRLLVGPTLIEHGSDDQRARYLGPALSGTEIWSLCLSEPDAGSDLAAAKTEALPVENDYVITGQKVWTSRAHFADLCLVLARTGSSPERHRNLSIFIVAMNQPGITVVPIRQMSGGVEFSEVFFDEVRVRADALVGPLGAGWQVLMTLVTQERSVSDAIDRFAHMHHVLRQFEECREHSGASMRDDALRRRLENFRWHIVRTAEELAELGDRHALIPSTGVMKLVGGQLWQDIARSGSALGCLEHENFWREEYFESRAVTIYSGTTQIQRNILADRVIGLPRK
jgi:alkylation response protein AidB-like acyl-CoA dehydrogenase